MLHHQRVVAGWYRRQAELAVAVNATLGGPPSAAAMAISAGWTRLVLPALLMGLLGYAVGTPLGIALHPTQVYEAGAELLILILLLATERRGRYFAGRTFWAYMFLYAVSRFVIEFYRGDDRGFLFNTLSTSQFISVILVPLSLFMLWYLSRPARPAEAPEAPRGPRKPRFV